MFEIFNYLAIVLSIVVGLGLTTALDALTRLVKYRKNIKIYWVPILWEMGVLLMLLLHWFGIWNYQEMQDWTFPKFLLLLLPAISLYITSHLAFPEIHEGKKYDMEDNYYRNRRYFFGAALSYFVFDGISSTLLYDIGNWFSLENGFRLAGIALVYISARSDNRTIHAVISILALAALIAFVLIFSNTALLPFPQ